MPAEILGGLQEILGADDLDIILGEDGLDDEMLGAAVRRAAARHNVTSRQPMTVKDSGFTKSRKLVLGFDSVANVGAGATAAVNSNPQQVFSPDRIAVPATLAPNFVLNSLTIGTAIQFLNATAVHAEVFGTTATAVTMKMDTAQINSVISLNVTNLSAAALRFFAALLGPSAQ